MPKENTRTSKKNKYNLWNLDLTIILKRYSPMIANKVINETIINTNEKVITNSFIFSLMPVWSDGPNNRKIKAGIIKNPALPGSLEKDEPLEYPPKRLKSLI